MSDAVKVTVSDPETGEVLAEQLVDNDYVVVCAGRTELTSVQRSANGTHQLTITGAP